ncbi:S9 family peptidase [Catenuloplanes atrovinosus]|uniref:Dipeptidyl aminopeptidase/acylaminoacyl peptidase n=1 Tax=Catenuloplanes atrovinosus TaxID=137266 RepID=A0AAE3YT93_9ACTN|nr:S9 family peptidase [Catenuloplanes atrovinosus]MDR7278230.1 dipeptidyl aminopeptidase/acylaminoacyl peptidase [Catenuloplanes atrovinosus]
MTAELGGAATLPGPAVPTLAVPPPGGPAPTPPGWSPATCASWSPSPAPDGGRVAYVSDLSGAPRAWVRDAREVGAAPVPLPTGEEPVTRVTWSPDGSWLVYLVAPGGAPRTEAWAIRPDGTDNHQIAGFGGTTVLLGDWIPGTSRLAVTETGTTACALVLDLATGARRTLVEGDLLCLLDVTADESRALLRRGPRGARWLEVLDTGTGKSEPLPLAGGNTDRGWFADGGATVLARTDAGSDLATLVAVTGGDVLELARRPDAELEDFAPTQDRRTVALLWNRYGGVSELGLLDLESREQRALPPPAGDVFDGCAFAADGGLLALVVQSAIQPRTIWLIDPALGEGRALGDDPTAPATPVPGEPSWPVVIAPQLCDLRSGDGLAISGWLYRPDDDHDGPWPTVISLHGGPEAQERPGHNPLFQALLARGLAVFAPNVRGSSGFGRSFVDADNRAGRYGAIADVAACVEYLVSSGVADPARIGCIGRSYGGYLTLTALVTFPELFAAGVSECGMSDFATFYERTEPWIAAAAVSKYGHPEHDRELLRDLSPLHRMDRLTAPLLLVHGANDTNVPVYESEQVLEALRGRDVPHDYLLLPGEGHDFLARSSRQTAITATARWLATHLASRG